MKEVTFSAVLYLCLALTALGQETVQTTDPQASMGLVRIAEATPNLADSPNGFSSRRTYNSMNLLSAKQWEYQPEPIQIRGTMASDPLSFASTQPVSKLLMNPDQFWNRKSRAVIDQSGDLLLGDPNCACDEWRGVCGCCGMKANPGHLGVRSLNSGAPCECVDDCCPAPRCNRRSHR